MKRTCRPTFLHNSGKSAKNVNIDPIAKGDFKRMEYTMDRMDREESISEILSYYAGREDKKEQETIASMLRELQEVCGGISPGLQERAASAADVKVSVIRYLVRMYSGLKETPYEHTVTVCTGERCRNKGGAAVLQAVRKELGIKKDDISQDGKVFLKTRGCLRNCGSSPNIIIDGELYPGVKPEKVPEILKKMGG